MRAEGFNFAARSKAVFKGLEVIVKNIIAFLLLESDCFTL